MKILILGAGQVGSSAAYNLSREEANEVTVVDMRADVLRELQDRLDIRTVVGHAAYPEVLDRAGASDADIIIALTDSDETNMVACQVAYTLYHTPTKIARIRAADYMGADALFSQDAFPVDVRISPEQLVCQYVEQLIHFPGALQVLDFADGRVRLVGALAERGGLLVDQKISSLKEHIPDAEGRIAALYRDGVAMQTDGDTVIREGDEVFFISSRKATKAFLNEMRKLESPVRRVFIAGGGNIGSRLARALEDSNQVKVVERNPERARVISEQLNKAIVLVGDAADEDLLIEENIDSVDVFCALTNAEEANILSAMLAKRLGAKKVMALINRPSYAELVESGTIDVAISPQQVTIGSLLAHVRRGDVVKVHSLKRGAAEAIEAVAHGSAEVSKVVGRKVGDIELPRGASIAAVVRGEDVIIAHHDTVIETDDHLILFMTDRRKVERIEELFSLTMLPPMAMAFLFEGRAWIPFAEGFVVTLAAGLVTWFPVRWVRKELRLRDGFLVVASFWAVLGMFGAFPLYFAHDPVMSFTDAVFESMSGLTTTGATVLTGIDELPKSILYYRHQLQWIGGMGIIVLAVAILPMLGVGGMQLYRAETPGPVKDTKLTPRITETAKALWYVYLAFTILCIIAYLLAGMSMFDALCHAFSTVSIGGFSTHDLNMGHFDSTAVELIAIVFMFIAGINFSLHFFAWRYNRISHYFQDPEVRAYFSVVAGVSVIVVLTLLAARTFTSPGANVMNGLFQAVSIATTTGFTTANFSDWPGAIPVLLVFASFIGGCAGSTAGGIKVIRWLLIYKQGLREIVRLVHPSAEIPVKLGSHAVAPRVVDAIWGFFSVYLIVFGFMLLAMMAAGLDQVTAFSAVAASLNNLGPGLGDVAIVFQTSDAPKWIAVVGMLLGRLEIFTLLVLVTPTFWRR